MNIKFTCKYILLLTVFSTLFAPVSAFARTETFFSPRTNLEKKDIWWLNKSLRAKRLYVAMYAFTDAGIARKLLYLARRGVKIYIYRDARQMKDRTDKTYMLENNVNILIKAKKDRGFWNIMHDKIFIIPGTVFREGSANWSPSGEGASCYGGDCGHSENQDNSATYITDRSVINAALRNFRHMWDRSSNIGIN